MNRTLLVFLLACSALSSVGGGLDGAFARAEETAGRLATKEPATWCVLTNAIELLEPTKLDSTNIVSVSGKDVVVHHATVPDGLSSRIVRFATSPRGFRPGPRRPPSLEKRRPSSPIGLPVSSRLVSDEELADHARQNADKRKLLLQFLQNHAGEMDPVVQDEWFSAFVRIWILPPYYPDGGCRRAAIRREEDGIPSAEAILEWFAENEAFCESVRADAKARLESLKKKSAPQPEAQPVFTTAAEGREQDARPVPEDVSSTAPNETEENKAP